MTHINPSHASYHTPSRLHINIRHRLDPWLLGLMPSAIIPRPILVLARQYMRRMPDHRGFLGGAGALGRVARRFVGERSAAVTRIQFVRDEAVPERFEGRDIAADDHDEGFSAGPGFDIVGGPCEGVEGLFMSEGGLRV